MSNEPKPYRLTSISEKGVFVKEINTCEKPEESDFYKRKSEGVNWGDFLNNAWLEAEAALQNFEVDRGEYTVSFAGCYNWKDTGYVIRLSQAITGQEVNGVIINVKLEI